METCMLLLGLSIFGPAPDFLSTLTELIYFFLLLQHALCSQWLVGRSVFLPVNEKRLLIVKEDNYGKKKGLNMSKFKPVEKFKDKCNKHLCNLCLDSLIINILPYLLSIFICIYVHCMCINVYMCILLNNFKASWRIFTSKCCSFYRVNMHSLT